MTIQVNRDMQGVRLAALEIFEEQLVAKNTERQMRNLPPGVASEEIAKYARPQSLSPGYGEFALYLLWMEETMEAGIEMAVLADEADGLRAIAQARSEFRSKHPACPACGTLQLKQVVIKCRGCGKEFKR